LTTTDTTTTKPAALDVATTVRADRVTPDVIDRRVLVTTVEDTNIMGVVRAYTIDVERRELPMFSNETEATVEVRTTLTLRLVGIVNEVAVRGDAEVKVLA